MFKEDEPKISRKLRLIEKEIPEEFVPICDNNDIPYLLVSGTANKAVRHSCFTPWYDDIDIEFLRDDDDKFCEVAPKEVAPDFDFINAHINAYFPALNSNLSNRKNHDLHTMDLGDHD